MKVQLQKNTGIKIYDFEFTPAFGVVPRAIVWDQRVFLDIGAAHAEHRIYREASALFLPGPEVGHTHAVGFEQLKETQDALEKQEAGKVHGSGSKQPEVREESRHSIFGGERVSFGGQEEEKTPQKEK